MRFHLGFLGGRGGTAPHNTVAPAVSGTETEGETPVFTPGTWTGTAPIVLTYQGYHVLLDDSDDPVLDDNDDPIVTDEIVGADDPTTYVYQSSDVGERVVWEEIATNTAGSATKLSNVTDVIAAASVAVRDVLDGLTGISGAWSSWQKLLTAYASNIGIIQRSSDSTTQSIGFSGDTIDEASVAAFVGGGTGAWNTVFDQSGNSRDFTQSASASAQPGYLTVGPQSRPAMDFDGSDDIMNNAASNVVLSVSTGYIAIAFMADVIANNNANVELNDGVIGDASGWSGLNLKSGSGGQVVCWNYDGSDTHADNPFSTGAIHVVEWRHESGNIHCRVDGGTETSAASGNTGGSSTFVIGKSANIPFNGKILDIVTFTTIPASGDRDALVAAMMTGVQ